MKDSVTKKELQSMYKEREIIGGVYVIKNILKNKLLLDTTLDLKGSKNRFEFAQKTDSCVHPKLQKDWTEQGCSQFAFEILEELKKGEAQAQSEFKSDIEILKKIWLEKLANENLY